MNDFIKINSKNIGDVYINLNNVIGMRYDDESNSIVITAIDGQTYKFTAEKEEFTNIVSL